MNKPAAAPKKRAMHPILLGAIVFVVMCGAILFNMFREVVSSKIFAPQWFKEFEVAANEKDKSRKVKAMEAAYAIGEKTPGSFPEKTRACYSLALWYEWTDRYEEARKRFLESADFAQKSQLPLDESNALSEIALLDHYAGKVKDGEQLAEKSLQIKIKEVGPDNELVGWVQSALAIAAQDAGHLARAEKAWLEAVRIEGRTKRRNGYPYIDANISLACCYALEGKRELADKTFIDNIKAADSKWGVGNESTESLIAKYACALKKTGDLKSARLLFSRTSDFDTYDSDAPQKLELAFD